MSKNKFKNAASDILEFCRYAKNAGFTTNQILSSKDFESFKEKFTSKKLGELGLIDPQFSAHLP